MPMPAWHRHQFQTMSAENEEIEQLRSRLYDTVSQNLKLMSIIELSKGTNTIFTTEQNLKLLCQTMQDNLDEHRFSLFLSIGTEWKMICIENEKANLISFAPIKIPDKFRDRDTTFFMLDKKEDAVMFESFKNLHPCIIDAESTLIYPLISQEDRKTLGFFIIQTDKSLDAEELRLLEICQRQISKLLQINYLYQLSNLDSLTGLFNRRYAESKLEYEAKRVNRRKSDLSILLLDLDNFKSINDNYGHSQGDLVLGQTGQMLLEELREVDIACRFGGEEFLVVLPDTDLKSAKIVAERIRANLEKKEFDSAGGTFNITTSIGIACYQNGRDQTYSELIERADAALYEAKTSGRNLIKVSDEN